ncbi:hypothetical protein BC937DRAFT_88666, partial [Endogone sp. FLAS-F59071]
ELDIITGANSTRKGDVSFQPRRRPQPPIHLKCNDYGSPYPTMVVEVGFTEDLLSLHRLAREYFSARTTIQVYLAIKIFCRYTNGTRLLVALLYLRTNANPLIPRAISFGSRGLHHATIEHTLSTIGIQSTIEIWSNFQLKSIPELDMYTTANSFNVVDGSIISSRVPRPPVEQACNGGRDPYPAMVIEIGNSQSLTSLYNLAKKYFSPHIPVQIYLAIKLYPRRSDGTKSMVALRFLRTNPTPTRPDVVISFGTAPLPHGAKATLRAKRVPAGIITGLLQRGDPPCDAPGIPAYSMNFPAAHLFNRDPAGVPAGLAASFNLDLWPIQTEVMS